MVAYIGGRYGLPLERLAQLYSSDPLELAKAHKITPKDALELMKSAAVAALPYMHQKQPVEIQTDAERFQLVIGDVSQRQVEAEAEHGLSVVLDLQPIENDDKSET